jgi:hypothetical protein
LPIDAAAEKLHYLLARSFALGLSGIGLKDESEAAPAELAATPAEGPPTRAIWGAAG